MTRQAIFDRPCTAGGDLAGMLLQGGGVLGAATAGIAIFASVSTLIGCYLAGGLFRTRI